MDKASYIDRIFVSSTHDTKRQHCTISMHPRSTHGTHGTGFNRNGHNGYLSVQGKLLEYFPAPVVFSVMSSTRSLRILWWIFYVSGQFFLGVPLFVYIVF